MSDFKHKLKEDIIEYLNLEDLKAEDIKDDEQLFGEGIGLDSIDALELIVLLEKDYGIKIEDPEEGRKVFNTINTMADFIQSKKK